MALEVYKHKIALWCSISSRLWPILNSWENDTALVTVANSTRACGPRAICYLHSCGIIPPLVQYRRDTSRATPSKYLGVFLAIDRSALKHQRALLRNI